MDHAFLHAAIVWGALGVALGCVVARLRPGPPPAAGGQVEPARGEDAHDPA